MTTQDYDSLKASAVSKVLDLFCSGWHFPRDRQVTGAESNHPKPGQPNIWVGVYWNGWKAWDPKVKKLWWAQIYFGIDTDPSFAAKHSWCSKDYETAEECLEVAQKQLEIVLGRYPKGRVPAYKVITKSK